MNKEKGMAVIFMIILVLGAMFLVLNSLDFLTLAQQKIYSNSNKSVLAYYASESGIEDALLKLSKNPNLPAGSYSLGVGSGTAEVSISEAIGGARTIISSGTYAKAARRVRAVYKITADAIGFHYGAQVGEGGIEMGNNARVRGNVFSNGSVIASAKGYIDDNIVVAGNGNKIKNLDIGGDALAYSCEDSDINGNLTYVAGGAYSTCNVAGNASFQAEEIQPEDLPISSSQVQKWKEEAGANVIDSDISYSGSSPIHYLGPIQIGTPGSPKNFSVTNGGRARIQGTIYVTGNVNFSNNAIIELDQSYGSFSGVIIADGKINIGNNVVLRGSGQAGSYMLALSANPSIDPASPAVTVGNNAAGAIFYATSGMIYLGNNMMAREITGYKIKINNNAEIQYESGLQNAIFSSGPGASWKIEEWKEIE